MEVTEQSSQTDLQKPTLEQWQLQSRKIGGNEYRGSVLIAEAVHVAYQQKSRTFGSFSSVVGSSYRGSGFVSGGGGYVETVNTNVATIVFRSSDGFEQSIELPASVAAREGSVVRLDFINNHVVAATNISGRHQPIRLMTATDFVGTARFTKWDVVLAICACGALLDPIMRFRFNHFFSAAILAAILAARPVFRLRNLQSKKAQRTQLAEYMREVMA